MITALLFLLAILIIAWLVQPERDDPAVRPDNDPGFWE